MDFEVTFPAVYKALRRWGVIKTGEKRPQWNKGKKFPKPPKEPPATELEERFWEKVNQMIMNQYEDESMNAAFPEEEWARPWYTEVSRTRARSYYSRNKHLPEFQAKWRERDKQRKTQPGFRDRANATKAKWKQSGIVRLRCNIGTRLAIAVRSIANGKKCASITHLVGCSMPELKSHIERQFTKRMTWANYGSYWHCDHIMPITYFDLSKDEEQARCSHFTNLRPLEASRNMARGNRAGIVQAPLGI